ncbi:MAG: sulfite reductase [NADPH] flavoprotein alpha-component, partial [Hyphomicrobiales bacterium]
MTDADDPGGTLTLEQGRLLQQLSRSVDPAQARWISGYFAGLGAGLARDCVDFPSEDSASQRSLTILYGTETGNAAELARALAATARTRGLHPTLSDMSDYKHRHLADEADLLIVVSTYGEGDPPQPAIGFFEYLEGRKAPRLEGKRFAVLA